MNHELSFIVACLRCDKQGSYWKLNLRTRPLFLDILQSIGHLRTNCAMFYASELCSSQQLLYY